MRSKTILCAVLLCVAWPAYAQDFQWKGVLAPDRTLEIKNVNGNIVAERAASNQAEVTAIKRSSGWRGDPDQVRIEVMESDAGITICAVYPHSGFNYAAKFFHELFSFPEPPLHQNICRPGTQGRLISGWSGRVKVDFTVKVPDGVHFTGRNVNGDIQALSLSGDVEGRTVNGDVRVSTNRLAQANTVNGDVDASLGALSRAAQFKTVNGDITVELSTGTQAALEAKTVNGKVVSEFPVTVTGNLKNKRLSGTIAGGGPQLLLEAVNGDIRLRQGH